MREPHCAASSIKEPDIRLSAFKKGNNGLITIGSITVTALYALMVLVFPSSERALHRLVIFLLMAVTSYVDIKEKQIPVIAISGIFILNVIHTVFFTGGLVVWIAAIVFSVLLLGIHLIKREAVGVGDIMLLSLGISSLAVDDILSFLFLSFLFSSVYGIVLVAFKNRPKAIVVPMAPCITLAWIAGCFLF